MVETGENINGQSSRIDIAAACAACLSIEATENKAFEIVNKGERPAAINWLQLFSAA